MNNISTSGISITLTGSRVLPMIQLTQFADDADPFDIDHTTISQNAMNANGDMVVWSTPTAKPITLNIIPGSDDDNNLQLIANSNTTQGRNIKPLDEFQMIASYQDGRRVIAKGGVIVSADLGTSAATQRRKSKQYVFAFQEIYSDN